jgi:hypothetical protein
MNSSVFISNMFAWSSKCKGEHCRRLLPQGRVSLLSRTAWAQLKGNSFRSLYFPACLKMTFEAPCSTFLTHFWVKARLFVVVVVVVVVALSTPKSRSRNSKPGYVSRKERCPSHREEDMRRCLLKSPACAPKDNSCYQDGTSDGAYYEIGGARTCDRGSWEESHVSQLLSLPQRKGR